MALRGPTQESEVISLPLSRFSRTEKGWVGEGDQELMSTKALTKCQAPARHSVFRVPKPHTTCERSATPTHSTEKKIKA